MDKDALYIQLRKQIAALVEGQDDAVSVMANVAAALHEALHTWWTGFYIWRGDALRLGPFQGPVACTRIPQNRGVCGAAYSQRCTIVVPDVHAFPDHIACSSATRSEIVVPIFNTIGEVVAVIDIDSEQEAYFDDTDRKNIEAIAQIVAPYINIE